MSSKCSRPWREDIYIPAWQIYESTFLNGPYHIPKEARPRALAVVLSILASWRQYKEVYRFAPEMENLLSQQADINLPLDTLLNLPFSCFYHQENSTMAIPVIRYLYRNNAIRTDAHMLLSILQLLWSKKSFCIFVHPVYDCPFIIFTHEEGNKISGIVKCFRQDICYCSHRDQQHASQVIHHTLRRRYTTYDAQKR